MTQPPPPFQQQAPVCPRHPDRISYVACQRCHRPVCPECQRQAAVGVQCVDCVNQANAGMRQIRATNGVVIRSRVPVLTYSAIALCALVYVLQLVVPRFTENFELINPFVPEQPWRLLTAGFLHSTATLLPVHLALNMLSLWFLGRVLEPVLGHWRFGLVFLIGALGGNVAQVWLGDPRVASLGASGAVFAIGAALLVELRKDRQQLISMAVVLGINLAYGFFLSTSIAWQAHVGGLITGLILGGIYAAGSKLAKRDLFHLGASILVAAALFALGLAGGAVALQRYIEMWHY